MSYFFGYLGFPPPTLHDRHDGTRILLKLALINTYKPLATIPQLQLVTLNIHVVILNAHHQIFDIISRPLIRFTTVSVVNNRCRTGADTYIPPEAEQLFIYVKSWFLDISAEVRNNIQYMLHVIASAAVTTSVDTKSVLK